MAAAATSTPVFRLATADPRTGLRYRFTVDDYYRMAEVGIIGPDERVELLDGEVIRMTPIGPLHGSHAKRLLALFSRTLGDRAVVSVQDPLRISEDSEPQPDVMLLHPRPDFYRTAHPQPSDVLLLVEVADTSLAKDLTVKVPLYARAGIPEVWVVDAARQVVLVHREPVGLTYRQVRELAKDDRLAPLAFPDQTWPVRDLLG